jgi:hypothetical protein
MSFEMNFMYLRQKAPLMRPNRLGVLRHLAATQT